MEPHSKLHNILSYARTGVTCLAIAAWGYLAVLLYPVIRRIDTATATLLDCKHGACLPSEILAIGGSIRYTSGIVARTMPALQKAAENAATNSAAASQETVTAAHSVNEILSEAKKTVVASQDTVRLLNADLQDLHELLAGLRPDLDALLKSTDATTKEAGRSLEQVTLLISNLNSQITWGSPEAMKILKDAQAILENPNLQSVLGNLNNASASAASVVETVNLATLPLRRKVNQVKWLIEKIIGIIKVTIPAF